MPDTQEAPKDVTPDLPPPRMRERRVKPEQPPMEATEAVEAAADGAELSGLNQATATDWFLSTDPADDLSSQRTIQIDVGTEEAEHWIDWTIQSVDAEVLRRLRKEATGNRASRRAGGADVDEFDLSARMIVEGTVDPPLRQIAATRSTDAKKLVLDRFAKKPGLLLLISDEINKISGFNEDNVREAQAGKT